MAVLPGWLSRLWRREYEAWLDRGVLHILGRFARLANYVLTFGPVVAGLAVYLTQKGNPGALWWLVGGLAISLFFLGLSALRMRILLGRATRPDHAPAESSDPRVVALTAIYQRGAEAIHTLNTSEMRLLGRESRGDTAPQGRPLEIWHINGARDLKKWRAIVEDEVTEILGAPALATLHLQEIAAPIKPIPSFVHEGYKDLWLESTHRMDWIRDEAKRLDPEARI